jgi:hypothetical protein
LARIYPFFAIVAVLLLAANFVAGLWIGDFNKVAHRKMRAQSHYNTLRAQRNVRSGTPSPATAQAVEQSRTEVTAAEAELAGPMQRMVFHMLLGTTAALATILVNSVAITYFVGTSRWCKEVVVAYELPSELAERMAALKRRTFRWALVAIFAIILVVGLGAASDPRGANFRNSAALVGPHYLAAMVSLALIVLSFWKQYQIIQENFHLLDSVMGGVREARARRGLPTEASPA